jgi:hypothetical protein
MRISPLVVVVFGMVTLLGATRVPVAPAPLAPLVVDWERNFTIDSQGAQRDGRPLVTGTVHNTSNCSAQRIQLLIDALNPDGGIVDQRVVWLGSDLTPGTHAYFEVPAVAPTASHRVSVFAFEAKKRC